MTIRAGLVGYGLAGRVFHAPLIQSARGIDLVAVASSRPDQVRGDLAQVCVVDSVDALVAGDLVDVIVVAAPNTAHHAVASAALAAGKHVVVDKPMTVTTREADALIDLARARGKILTVFHNRRWDADYLTVKDCVSSGRLGRLSAFESRYDRFRPEVRDRWRERDEPGSGTWFDLGSHLVDQAIDLFGHPRAILADLQRQRRGAQATDYFHTILDYETLRVVLHGGSLVPAASLRFAAHGDRCSLVKHGLDSQEDQLKAGLRPGDSRYGEEPDSQAAELICAQVGAANSRQRIQSSRGTYDVFYESLVEAIVSGASPPVSDTDGRNVVAVIEAGEESSQRGCFVSLASRLRQP